MPKRSRVSAGQGAWTRALDVRDRAAQGAAIGAFAAAAGRLDVFHANAGIGRGGPFEIMAWEDIEAVVQVNLLAVLAGVRAAIPHLKATAGSMAFLTSSSSATFGMAGIAVYSATKHAVKGFTEALSVELKAAGVRVCDTLPGLIDTPLLPEAAKLNADKQGPWRLTPPSAVANAVWSAYHSDRIHWYVPEDLAGFDAFATTHPEQVRDQMAVSGGVLRAGDLPAAAAPTGVRMMTDLFEPLALVRGPPWKNRLMLAPLTNCQSHAGRQAFRTRSSAG